MTSLGMILLQALNIFWFILIAHIIMSWLINFGVLNIYQPVVRAIWEGLNRILEPIYRPLRRLLPPMGGLDFTPIIVLFGVYALRVIIANNLL